MAFTDLMICNLAIDRCAGDRLDAMDEESPLGSFCATNYPHKREVLLGKYRWTFANSVALLARVEPDAAEPRPCAYKYAKPADLLGAINAYRRTADPDQDRGGSPYVLEANGYLWADQSPLFAEYTANKPEAAWPGWFRNLVVTAFAADVADFCQLGSKARDFRAEAWGTPGMDGEGGLYAQARNEDARMAPQRKLDTGVSGGPLVDARYGGGGGLGRFGFSGFRLESEG